MSAIQSYLLFVRSKIAWNGKAEITPWSIEGVQRVFIDSDGTINFEGNRLFVDEDSVLLPIYVRSGETVEQIAFGDKGPPTWVDFYEALALGRDIAVPFDLGREEDNQDDDRADPSDDASRFIRMRMVPPTFDVAVFDRKLLLVSIDRELSQRQREVTVETIRRRIGRTMAVWPGRSFTGLAFRDTRVGQQVIWGLKDVLEIESIVDYLLVQPAAVVATSVPSLSISPLAHWIETAGQDDHLRVRPRPHKKTTRPLIVVQKKTRGRTH